MTEATPEQIHLCENVDAIRDSNESTIGFQVVCTCTETFEGEKISDAVNFFSQHVLVRAQEDTQSDDAGDTPNDQTTDTGVPGTEKS